MLSRLGESHTSFRRYAVVACFRRRRPMAAINIRTLTLIELFS